MIVYINAFIVYALCDARTHQIRYVGCSEIGLARPVNLHNYKHNTEVSGWLRDLAFCGSQHVVLVLATAVDVAELRAAERFWITQGKRWGWPLLNQQGFSLDIEEPERLLEEAKEKRWKIKNWRMDPEVKAQLAKARERKGAWKKK